MSMVISHELEFRAFPGPVGKTLQKVLLGELDVTKHLAPEEFEEIVKKECRRPAEVASESAKDLQRDVSDNH